MHRVFKMRSRSALLVTVESARRFVGVCLLLMLGCGGESGRQAPMGDAAVRTLAYVVTECRDERTGSIGRQRLEILRGAGPPVVVHELPAVGPLDGPPTLCANYGLNRFGFNSLPYGVFQRVGVSPDASIVVFEVTDAWSQQPIGLDPDQQGIFVVRADGSGLRRLAPPSREAPFRIIDGGLRSISTEVGFSPDNASVVYTDLGPGPDGHEAVQIIRLDLATGKRTPLTQLPEGRPSSLGRPATQGPFFLDNQRVAFFSTANPDELNPGGQVVTFTVTRDGKELRVAAQPVIPGGPLVPNFMITGPDPRALLLPPCRATLSGGLNCTQTALGSHGFEILDVFLVDGANLLQLTDFGVDDLTEALVGTDGRTVFFNASINPGIDAQLGQLENTNPLNNCQFFSIDRNGGSARQLTQFDEGRPSRFGCYFGTRAGGCGLGFLSQDPATDTLVFYSNCNLFAPKDFIGAQIFAMRPDGSGLRQLTHARGLVRESDGTFVSELPGPFWSSAPVQLPPR